MKVRKAVFPIVGLGTRFLPATKAMAKEMLPIVDKPLIQYAVKQTCKYGILDADPLVDGITKIRGLVEKPQPEAAPSNLAIIGRYILTPEIFEILQGKEVGAGGEIQITDAMARLLESQSIYGYRYKGTRFDCGNKVGFQMANLAFSLDRPDMRDRLMPFIHDLIKRY